MMGCSVVKLPVIAVAYVLSYDFVMLPVAKLLAMMGCLVLRLPLLWGC